MSFTSGVFTLIAGNPVVTGTTISSTWANNTLTDIATGLSTCILKDGTQTITANIPHGGFKITGLGAGVISGDAIRYEQVLGVVTTAGDTLYATAAGTLARAATLKSFGYGDTWGPGNGAGGGDLVNDITIAAGGCMDVTGAYWIQGAALTKQLDAAWAVGTGVGGLDTGSIGDSDYYIFRIARSDTGVTDALFSLSPTAPTMPANYDFKRLRGWFKRVGGTIVAFHTYETEGGGVELTWDSPTLDINLSNTLTTARRTDAVKVPLNFSTIAHLNVSVFDAAATADIWVYCPDQTDVAPQPNAAPLSNANVLSAAVSSAYQLRIRTSAAGLIAARADLATVDRYFVATVGFAWARRN